MPRPDANPFARTPTQHPPAAPERAGDDTEAPDSAAFAKTAPDRTRARTRTRDENSPPPAGVPAVGVPAVGVPAVGVPVAGMTDRGPDGFAEAPPPTDPKAVAAGPDGSPEPVLPQGAPNDLLVTGTKVIEGPPERRDIRELDRAELEAWFASVGEPRFRVKQLEQWLWQHGVTEFAMMSNLGKSLRAKLARDFVIPSLQEDARQVSADGTIKLRFRLHDGHLVESVLIPVVADGRFTVCVSSQVGCSLTCAFCATGRMARVRNLTASEIVDQVRLVDAACVATFGRGLTNVVYMGMGEPLLAYRAVLRSIDLITSPEGLGMSPRRLTISTAGIAKAIRRLADDGTRVNLALSLHAADDAKRSAVMPINDTNDLASLMDALEDYYNRTHNRVSFEYIALRDFNDSEDDAHALASLCRRFPVRVNVIEYNPIGDPRFGRSAPETIDRFARVLQERGVTVTVRRSRGKDIDAACGQLANKG